MTYRPVGTSQRVTVVGLKENMALLRAAGRTLPRAAARGMKTVIQRHTLKEARGNLMSQPIPKRVGMITAFATQREAGIRMKGAPRYPWAHGGEFGARQYKQFKGWVGNQYTGGGSLARRYIAGPAIEASFERVAAEVSAEVKAALVAEGQRGLL